MQSASELISKRIDELADWRGKTLARMRKLILAADPGVVEEWKWDIPVWSHAGILCTGETYRSAVKLTFARGAHLADPARLFNASLEGNLRRAIDIREGEVVDAAAFQALMREAARHNASRTAKPATKSATKPARKPTPKPTPKPARKTARKAKRKPASKKSSK